MLSELKIFRDVIEKLNNNNIPYMISGSVAMNYYTTPRMTRDIDIIIEIKNIKAFYGTFKKDYYINQEMVSAAVKHQQMFNIIHLKEVIKIDFIIRKNTEYRKTEFERRKKVEIDGMSVFIVSIEDLIISKLLWGKDRHSELQMRDVKNLLKERLDKEYIDHWVKKLHIDDFYQEAADEIK